MAVKRPSLDQAIGLIRENPRYWDGLSPAVQRDLMLEALERIDTLGTQVETMKTSVDLLRTTMRSVIIDLQLSDEEDDDYPKISPSPYRR